MTNWKEMKDNMKLNPIEDDKQINIDKMAIDSK